MTLTTVDAGMLNSQSQQTWRNRIINGAMVIDQRNAGAALTVNSGTDFFPVDRFLAVGTASSGVFTVQRSSTAPTGFINSILATVTTADASLAATDQYYVSQIIEGLNVTDLAWGTASAATVTLSFWVYSSLTGTFGGAIKNSAQNRSYPFTYTISVANTWGQKSVTITGDTSGTWLTTNGKGLDITWTLGLGSTFSGTAGAWAAANYKGASGVTNVMATNGATFYITGVQLEKGSTATSFDYRPYGTELALCQRYCYVQFSGDTSTQGTARSFGIGGCTSTTGGRVMTSFSQSMRTSPSVTFETASNYMAINSGDSGNPTLTAISLQASSLNTALINITTASGLVGGNATRLTGVNSAIYPVITYSAEL